MREIVTMGQRSWHGMGYKSCLLRWRRRLLQASSALALQSAFLFLGKDSLPVARLG